MIFLSVIQSALFNFHLNSNLSLCATKKIAHRKTSNSMPKKRGPLKSFWRKTLKRRLKEFITTSTKYPQFSLNTKLNNLLRCNFNSYTAKDSFFHPSPSLSISFATFLSPSNNNFYQFWTSLCKRPLIRPLSHILSFFSSYSYEGTRSDEKKQHVWDFSEEMG